MLLDKRPEPMARAGHALGVQRKVKTWEALTGR